MTTIDTGEIRRRHARFVTLIETGDRPGAKRLMQVHFALVDIPALCDALEAERERVRLLREVLAGVCGDEPPISDLTNGYPWAGCSYCYGPSYDSAYHKRLRAYPALISVGEEPPPEPGEDDYAPFTEHTPDCPWAAGRDALAAGDGEVMG